MATSEPVLGTLIPTGWGKGGGLSFQQSAVMSWAYIQLSSCLMLEVVVELTKDVAGNLMKFL